MNSKQNFIENFIKLASLEEAEILARSCKMTLANLYKAVAKYELSVREVMVAVDLVKNYQTKIFTVARMMESYSLETISSALEVREGVPDTRDDKGRIICYKPSLKCLAEYIELFHEENSTSEDILGEIEEYGLYDGARMKKVVKIAKENNVADVEIATRLAFAGKKRDVLRDPLLLNDPDHEEDDFEFNLVEGNYESL